MKYFKEEEFFDWWHEMDPKLLEVLDKFRGYWNAPVQISPVNGGLGRRDNSKSFHNVNRWGKVLAADIFPQGLDTREDFRIAVKCAEKAGAKGIGIYPDWRLKGASRPGMHLDVGRRGGDGLGYWSAYRIRGRQKYFAISKALESPS